MIVPPPNTHTHTHTHTCTRTRTHVTDSASPAFVRQPPSTYAHLRSACGNCKGQRAFSCLQTLPCCTHSESPQSLCFTCMPPSRGRARISGVQRSSKILRAPHCGSVVPQSSGSSPPVARGREVWLCFPLSPTWGACWTPHLRSEGMGHQAQLDIPQARPTGSSPPPVCSVYGAANS